MHRRLHQLRRVLGPLLWPARRLARQLDYAPRRWLGRAAGSYRYIAAPASQHRIAPWFSLDVQLDTTSSVTPDLAQAWCARQTLESLSVTAFDTDGAVRWRVDQGGEAAASTLTPGAFAAPGAGLPVVAPAWAETALMLLAAEDIDTIVLEEQHDHATSIDGSTDVLATAGRRHAVFRHDGYRFDPRTSVVVPRPENDRQLVKVIGPNGVGVEPPRDREHWNAHRRGPYHSARALPPVLEIAVRDLHGLPRPVREGAKPAIIILFPFFAYGGVEQLFLEVLSALADDFTFVLVTLAPHRAERGDRRRDLATVSDHFYCLGDLVHPAAISGILSSLIARHQADVLFNANGTTLFYELAPRLRARHPGLRIIDQLYDHRVGYIRWYDETVKAAVDTCVASNHPIARELVDRRGWTAERVPVIWHCGRRDDAYPSPDAAPALRANLRQELRYGERDLLFLTAARMNAQKRPLDLVRLAQRLKGAEEVAFLVVGGGELEDEVDDAIQAARAEGARIRRLPFRDDIPSLAVATDVGCLVSEFEGLPVFMMECLQAGRPFLGTDTGDMGSVLRDTGAGIVVDEPGDLDALEAAVHRLRDPEIRAHMAAAANDAAKLFSVDTCARRYRDLFEGRL